MTPLMPPCRRESGFTLLELLAVLVIIAVASAMVIPSVRSGTQQREVRRTVQRFVASVRAGSYKAVRERRRVGLEVDLEEGTFGVMGASSKVELPSFGSFGEVRGGYTEGERDAVVFDFYPTGGSAGGSVELRFDGAGGRQGYILSIDPLLSKVRIEETR